MAVLIEGMEMPTSCGKCKLFDTSHAIGLFSPLGWCRVNGKEIFQLSEKAYFCPLVPVPEPHGDLIDRQALLEGEGRYFISLCKEGIDVDEILMAKAVIPASKEE